MGASEAENWHDSPMEANCNRARAQMTSVSIIIPAWNEAKTISATLEALLGIEYDKKCCEVIVVSGGNDNTYELARKLSRSMGSIIY